MNNINFVTQFLIHLRYSNKIKSANFYFLVYKNKNKIYILEKNYNKNEIFNNNNIHVKLCM
jgi:hypothetical protein